MRTSEIATVSWAANKRFEISKFKFKIPRARTCELQGSFSAVQVPARVPKRAPLVELVLTMTSMRGERKDKYWQCVCVCVCVEEITRLRGIGTDRRDYRDGSKGSEGSEGIGRIASDREGS